MSIGLMTFRSSRINRTFTFTFMPYTVEDYETFPESFFEGKCVEEKLKRTLHANINLSGISVLLRKDNMIVVTMTISDEELFVIKLKTNNIKRHISKKVNSLALEQLKKL